VKVNDLVKHYALLLLLLIIPKPPRGVCVRQKQLPLFQGQNRAHLPEIKKHNSRNRRR
jgi:hypothetical protein